METSSNWCSIQILELDILNKRAWCTAALRHTQLVSTEERNLNIVTNVSFQLKLMILCTDLKKTQGFAIPQAQESRKCFIAG
jgi:hypothetical protein